MLSRDRSAALLKWMHDAYTYHPANLNMCWASILLRYANAPGGWPDVGQTVEEQRQFDEFAAFFLREWDRDGFNARLEAEQGRLQLRLRAWLNRAQLIRAVAGGGLMAGRPPAL